MSQNNDNDQSKQSIPVQEDTDLQIAQTEKYGHIKVYEPINED